MTTWGEVATLEYGKALDGNNDGSVPVFGTNGPTGSRCALPLCPRPAVIVGRKGAYRGIHWSPEPFWVIDTAFFLVPDPERVDAKWAYYELLTRDINGMDSGSAIPSTSRPDFYAMPLAMPPLDEQRRIAGVLSALDTKIEHNRCLATTLDAITQALFIAAPRGEKVVSVQDVADINGQTHSARSHPQKIEYVDISSVAPRQLLETQELSYADAPSRARRIVETGDTLVSTVRPERRAMLFVARASKSMTASTGFAVISPRAVAPTFIYRVITSDPCIDHLAAAASGSAYPAVNARVIAEWKFELPADRGAAYERVARPLEDLRWEALDESRRLAAIRDTLLPKSLFR